MYLPKNLSDDIDYHFAGAYREIQRQHDIEIEKNRHWYPLVVELGLTNVSSMDPDEIVSELRERDMLNSA